MATVALTSRGLSSPSAFHPAVRKAIKAGLPADEALACITTRPARLLGIDSVAGTIAPGRLANLVVIEGELFDLGDYENSSIELTDELWQDFNPMTKWPYCKEQIDSVRDQMQII